MHVPPGTTSIHAFLHHIHIHICVYICQDAASLRAFGELLLACEAQLPTSFVGPSVYGEARPGELVQGLAESLRQLLAARGDTLESVQWVQWTASPPAKTARATAESSLAELRAYVRERGWDRGADQIKTSGPGRTRDRVLQDILKRQTREGQHKEVQRKELRVEPLTPAQVAAVAASLEAEKQKRLAREVRAAAATTVPGASAAPTIPETPEAQSAEEAEEAEEAQLRSLLLDDSPPSDLAADYGGEAYDAAEAEVEQARREVAKGAREVAQETRLAIKNRKATLIQQAFLTRAERRRRATADPAVEMYLERLERFALLEKQTKQVTDESEAALEAAGTQCCFCGVPWGRKHATTDGFRHFGRVKQFKEQFKPLVAEEACPMLARCAVDMPPRVQRPHTHAHTTHTHTHAPLPTRHGSIPPPRVPQPARLPATRVRVHASCATGSMAFARGCSRQRARARRTDCSRSPRWRRSARSC